MSTWTPNTPPLPGDPGTPPPARKHRLRWILGGLGAAILLIIVLSVASNASKPAASPAPPPPATSSTTPAAAAQNTDPSGQQCASLDTAGYCPGDDPGPSASPSSLTGPVGTAYTVSSTGASGNAVSYDVTATRVLDPATGSNEFDTPDSGNRFVGVEFTIKGDTGYASDDANNDAAILGSDGQTYQPDFSSLSAGTNFNSGDFGVTAGQTEVGWVAFQLPQGVSVTAVQWQSGIGGGQPATWTVSS